MLISQHIDGIAASKEALRGVQDRMQDMRPVWGVLQAEFYNIEEDLFASEGETGEHGAWDDISDATRARRDRRNDSGADRILHDSGALEASLTRPNQLGSRRVFTAKTMTIGSDLPQGAYVAAKGRRPIDFTVSQAEYFKLQVQRYVMGEIHP